MKILFICNQGENRSRTAKELFSKRYNTKSAGLFALIKENRVSKYVLDWADLILVMEEFQRSHLAEHFPEQYLKKKILVMDIPDIYRYNQPELVELLRKKLKALKKSF